ncbi:MAG: SMP-30/gluconolactonase/LRE family protein [Thermoanaerobaculaceae bacterium]
MRKVLAAFVLLPAVVVAGEPLEPTLALRRAARTAVKEGRTAEALATLRTLAGFPGGIYLFEEPWLAPLGDDPVIRQLRRDYERDYPPVVHSELAFTVAGTDLIPEGLAFDPVDRLLYMGSMPTHSILRLTLDGKASTFVAPGQDGIGEVIGIRVDPGRRALWAASLGEKECAVLAFDLATGRLRRKAVLPREGHLLNDLVVTPGGDVVVTDSDGNRLYRLRADGGTLEPLTVAVRLPNGIALAPDGASVYVAEVEAGILRVDLATLEATPLQRPARLSLLGIDGLYARDRELVAVHNWQYACQVVRYRLDAAGTTIERVDVLERRDPRFVFPTTGAVVDGWFYFMGNTQIDRFPGSTITPGPPLQPIQMLRTKL